jgi:predicted nuclease of predicted toxin-antitoxin system
VLRLGSDADVPGKIIRGLRRWESGLDLVRVQDVGLRTADGPIILDWAATEGRVLLTRDRSTMVGYAYERTTVGLAMPGVIVLNDQMSSGNTIEHILIIAVCHDEDEMKDRVIFLPIS